MNKKIIKNYYEKMKYIASQEDRDIAKTTKYLDSLIEEQKNQGKMKIKR